MIVLAKCTWWRPKRRGSRVSRLIYDMNILSNILSFWNTPMNLFNRKVWSSYSFFKKRGLKAPPYIFFFGNFIGIRKKIWAVLIIFDSPYSNLRKLSTNGLRSMERPMGIYRHGNKSSLKPIKRFYEGHTPVQVTSDLDLI